MSSSKKIDLQRYFAAGVDLSEAHNPIHHPLTHCIRVYSIQVLIQMIDKLNNTLSAALARGERRRKRRELDICGRDPPCSIIKQSGLVFVLFACICNSSHIKYYCG
jgi:hypothetical protein